jgi:stage V sporulation protein G
VEITEVRIKLMEDPGERLKAFCSVTFDNCFVVRDLKIIEGVSGPFVAMPSRKLTSHCPQCGTKNHLRAQHCNQCGSALALERTGHDLEGRAKLYADIAHPINSTCREMIQQHVIQEFQLEIERAKLPDYVSRYDDFDVEFGDTRPAAAQHRSADARVDQAHDKRGSHVEHPGGGTRPLPAPKAPTGRPSAGAEKSFGAGIFGED